MCVCVVSFAGTLYFVLFFVTAAVVLCFIFGGFKHFL